MPEGVVVEGQTAFDSGAIFAPQRRDRMRSEARKSRRECLSQYQHGLLPRV